MTQSLRVLFFLLAAFAFFVLRADPAAAAVLCVPDQFPTIQSAVDAARDGDTIHVAPGTYAESVTWTDKRIRLTGSGPDVTILDPSLITPPAPIPGARCLTLTNVPSGALLAGFTCQHGSLNGRATFGGAGMFLQDSSLTIKDFVFANNTSFTRRGGGVSVLRGNPGFVDVTFRENIADFAIGGGMFVDGAQVTLLNCIFDTNTSNSAHGGIFASSAELSLVGCTFRHNGGEQGVGAIGVGNSTLTATLCTFESNGAGRGSSGAVSGGDDSSGTFVLCRFDSNIAGAFGGAINGFGELTVTLSEFTGNRSGDAFGGAGGAISTAGTLSVMASRFDDNSAYYTGGGAIYSTTSATIVNSMFRNNETATGSGGALAVRGTARIANTIFVGNQAPAGKGGGLWVTGAGTEATVLQSIFHRNVAMTGGAVAVDAGASATIINSILVGDTGGEIDAEGTVTVIHSIVRGGFPGAGNLDANPHFAEDGDGNLHLLPDSPAIGAGRGWSWAAALQP